MAMTPSGGVEVTPKPEAGSWYILDPFTGPPWAAQPEAGSWYILDPFYPEPRRGRRGLGLVR
jgi:hypothetical protein